MNVKKCFSGVLCAILLSVSQVGFCMEIVSAIELYCYDVLDSVRVVDSEGIVRFIPADPENTDYQTYLEWKQTHIPQIEEICAAR